ncbi:MAG: NYN domain-containing protein [Deltaproteobacteria bacterium]|nr:NYN domain-containing protein [Deltaproteobacteria bacterium]
MSDEPLIAVFVDFENLALGVRDMKGGGFKVDIILKRLLEKGRIVFKRAYCDWSHYQTDVRDFHKNGIELVDIPRTRMSGKNSADIHMVVDALDLCYSKDHIDIFALLTGDSDFSPLVSKLKENNKRVIGCGVKESTSNLLISNCDEFIYYDDLVRALEKGSQKRERGQKRRADRAGDRKSDKPDKPDKPDKSGKKEAPKRAARQEPDGSAERKPEAMDMLLEIVESLTQDYDQIWGSMIKQTIRRVYPGFNESYLGYRNFAELIEHAQDEGYIELDFDESRGNYRVRLLD